MISKFLTLNQKDFLKGLLLSVLTAVVTIVYKSVEAGSLTFYWKAIGTTALATALSYLLKNLLTNSQGEILKSEK
jgi:hypothetical protein